MEALNTQIQILEEQLAKFWRRNSQSNPGAHMEVRELKQELRDLQQKRRLLQTKPLTKPEDSSKE